MKKGKAYYIDTSPARGFLKGMLTMGAMGWYDVDVKVECPECGAKFIAKTDSRRNWCTRKVCKIKFLWQ